MFGFGPTELLIILFLLIVFYGGKRLPQIGEGLGRSITEFKKSMRGSSESTAGDKPLEAKTNIPGKESPSHPPLQSEEGGKEGAQGD